jgi:predicted acetyltransferase
VDDVRLVEPSLSLAEELRAFVADYAQAGEDRYQRLGANAADAELAEYIELLRRDNTGKARAPGLVPQTNFWLVRSDGMILGASRLRHYLNPGLEIEGGHIGYDIRPSQRRHGYGTQILALTLVEARKLGLRRVLVTCDDDNVGSARIIERNGGVLQDLVTSPESGKLIRRYWISLE